MSDHAATPTRPEGFWPWALGVLGTFLIFGAILSVVYLPSRQVVPTPAQPTEDNTPRTPEARRAKLEEVSAAAKKAYTTYEVVDAKAGVVRLPVERAMELVVAEQSGAAKP